MIFRTLAVTAFSLYASLSFAGEKVALFDGSTLNGWQQVNGKAPYAVEDGAIVGTYVADSPNSFLATEKEYGDFILEFDVKADSDINSGVQFRSHSKPDFKEGRVHGYQAEIDAKEPEKCGGIYDEQRDGWLSDNRETGTADAIKAAWKPGEWNHYKIEAVKNRVRTWVNEVPAATLENADDPEGFIALQVHSIGNMSLVGKKIRWKNITLEEVTE